MIAQLLGRMSVVTDPGSLAQIRNTDIFPFPFIVHFLLRMNRIFFQNSSVTFLRRIPQHEVTMHEIIVLACVAGVIRRRSCHFMQEP